MARSSKDIQLSELKDMIAQLNMTIKTLNDTIARQQSENYNLKAELAWFRQKLFGSSSERRMDDIAGQMSLFENQEEEKPVELIEPEVVEQPKKSRKKKPTLAEQFKDIPTRQVTVNTKTEKKPSIRAQLAQDKEALKAAPKKAAQKEKKQDLERS